MTLVTLVVSVLVLILVWRLVSTRLGLVSITAVDLEKRLATGRQLVLVDVRKESEYRQGHLEGALLRPLKTLEKGDHGLPKEKPIVLVCARGIRSAKAFQVLKRQGYTNISTLSGGMAAWVGPVVR